MTVYPNDLKKQSAPSVVDLYILDLNAIGIAEVFYFYPGTNPDSSAVEYLRQSYAPWPIVMSGFIRTGSGSSNRPRASISNYQGAITQQLALYDDLVGASVTRRRVFSTYLVNNIAQYSDEIYFIEQKTLENFEVVEFELANPMDFIDKKLPGRTALANACPWRYRQTANGSGCGWPGTDPAKWFNAAGDPVGNSSSDVCGKRLSDCKLRFGATQPLDFGGFPSLGRTN